MPRSAVRTKTHLVAPTPEHRQALSRITFGTSSPAHRVPFPYGFGTVSTEKVSGCVRKRYELFLSHISRPTTSSTIGVYRMIFERHESQAERTFSVSLFGRGGENRDPTREPEADRSAAAQRAQTPRSIHISRTVHKRILWSTRNVYSVDQSRRKSSERESRCPETIAQLVARPSDQLETSLST